MRVPKGVVAGFAGKANQGSRNIVVQGIRESYLPLLISVPIIIRRVKSPVKFLLASVGVKWGRNGIIEFRDGMRLKTRGTMSEFKATLETCIWEIYTRDSGLVPADDLVVIDIGGHIGTFSVSTAWRYQKSKVYSYEPLKDNFELLESNVKENGLTNVYPEMVAVAGRKGTATLHVSKGNTGAHSLFFGGDSDVTVNTIPLAEVFASHEISKCDFLKMDCEGAEYEILFSSPSSVLKLVRNIALEYHNYGELTCMDIAKFLRANGFRVSFVGKPRLEKNAIGLITATNLNREAA